MWQPQPPQPQPLPVDPARSAPGGTGASDAPDAPDQAALLPDQDEEEAEPEHLPQPSPWAAGLREKLKASKDDCALAVSHSGPFEDCSVTVVGQGNALVLTVVTECGGDSCSTQSWLLREDQTTPTLLGDLGGGFAFSPALDYYVVDYRAFVDEADLLKNYYQRPPKLQRVTVVGGKSTHFADCFSPTLSPGGKWFLCRNRRGDVLRIPVQGGRLQLVAKNPTKELPVFSPYAYIYPGEPYFYTPNEVCFRSGVEGDDAEQKAPWTE